MISPSVSQLVRAVMEPTQKKIIVVFGATGAQGSSVAQALLEDGAFHVRAVTRDPSQPAAQALLGRGVEVVKGDLSDLATLESIMKGAYGAFVVTMFSQDFSKEPECRQGKNTAEAAKRQGLKHVVFSGLDHVEKLTNGRLKVPFFDSKGEAETHYQELGVPFTSVRLPCYFENFLNYMRPQKDTRKNSYTLAIPMGDTPMHAMSVSDLGTMMLNIFKAPEIYIGKIINLSVEALTVQRLAEILSQCLGKDIQDAKISVEAYEQQASKAIADMFRYIQLKTGFDTTITRQLNPKAKSFQQWVEENKSKFEDL